ncbi:MAG: 3-oxoacyl-ACP reductase [Desulfobacteraceae bacterium 4572_88]|nr:MAG: 3-oxoacyl-ACP reductase [Desulfobacteraceae bacterium 4572_88]
MEISGKKVIVTGGARGIGKQFAMDLKELGAQPYVVDVVQENLDALKADTGIPGSILDVTSDPDVVAFFEKYTAENGAPDVLINNAGITMDGLFVRQKGDEVNKLDVLKWQKVIDVNLTGVFLCGREAAAQMMKNGVKGVIINISSVSRAGNFGQTNYSATKAGVAAMTVTWAKELAKAGIRAAAIAPGYIRTEMTDKIDQKIKDKINAQIPAGRFGEMKEISQTVKFIIECDYVNGRVLEIDGGLRI